jgi:hypothetical protein
MTNASSYAAPKINALAQQPSPVEFFDFSSEAELFPARSQKHKRRVVGYRRFSHAADAIRFAVEELPPEQLVGAYLEVAEERYGGDEIRCLYDRPDFPRRPRATV